MDKNFENTDGEANAEKAAERAGYEAVNHDQESVSGNDSDVEKNQQILQDIVAIEEYTENMAETLAVLEDKSEISDSFLEQHSERISMLGKIMKKMLPAISVLMISLASVDDASAQYVPAGDSVVVDTVEMTQDSSATTVKKPKKTPEERIDNTLKTVEKVLVIYDRVEDMRRRRPTNYPNTSGGGLQF